MPEELLHGPDVVAGFEQMRRERMEEGVPGGRLCDPGLAYGAMHGAPQDGFVELMAAPLSRIGIFMDAGRRKDHCHGHSRPGLGYFRARAYGSSTQPAPVARSLWWSV